jgi:hypothetical protein
MDIADARHRKREVEDKILEVLKELERDSGLIVDGLRMHTVEHTDGTTSVMSIDVDVTL